MRADVGCQIFELKGSFGGFGTLVDVVADDDDDDDVFWQLPATLSTPTIPSPFHESKSEC